MKNMFKYFFSVCFFLSFLVQLSIAEPLELTSEYNKTREQISSLSLEMKKTSLSSPQLSIELEKKEIYSSLLNFLIDYQAMAIDSEIKEKLLLLLENDYFRKTYTDHGDAFVSLFFTIQSIHENENKAHIPIKKSVLIGSKNKGSIYYVNTGKNSSVPSVFFRTKDKYRVETDSKNVFVKFKGGIRLVRQVVGYPDMKEYALSVLFMPKKIKELNEASKSSFIISAINLFLKEKDIHKTLQEKIKEYGVSPSIQKMLYIDSWIPESEKIKEKCISIQPFYRKSSLLDYAIDLIEEENKELKLNNNDRYLALYKRNFLTILKLLKQSAYNFHLLDSTFKFIHRDIKLDNILVDEKNDELLVRIADLDHSIFYSNEEDESELTVLSRDYVAPECESRLSQNVKICTLRKADIYSFGRVMDKVLDNYIIPTTLKKFTSDINSYYNPILELIHQTLHIEPNKRPSFEKIANALEHIEKNQTHLFFTFQSFTNSYYEIEKKDYDQFILELSQYNQFPFPNKTADDWKTIFSYHANEKLIYIYGIGSNLRKIIKIDPQDFEKTYREIIFLYDLGVLK